jgi:hypothetical protein
LSEGGQPAGSGGPRKAVEVEEMEVGEMEVEEASRSQRQAEQRPDGGRDDARAVVRQTEEHREDKESAGEYVGRPSGEAKPSRRPFHDGRLLSDERLQ